MLLAIGLSSTSKATKILWAQETLSEMLFSKNERWKSSARILIPFCASAPLYRAACSLAWHPLTISYALLGPLSQCTCKNRSWVLLCPLIQTASICSDCTLFPTSNGGKKKQMNWLPFYFKELLQWVKFRRGILSFDQYS